MEKFFFKVFGIENSGSFKNFLGLNYAVDLRLKWKNEENFASDSNFHPFTSEKQFYEN